MQTDPVIAAAAFTYVMETAPVLALRLDTEQHVVSANAQALRVLGPAAVGRTLAELVVDFTPPPAGAGHQLLSLKTANGGPESYQFRQFALPDGTLALGSLDFPEQAHLQSEVLGLNRELNDLTRQLHLANAELRELNQLKNQFLGMAAHDLRKPVGVIMTYLEFVLDEAGAQLTAQHREFLRTGLAAATGMKQLIDNFLDVAIIESGKLRLDCAPASVPEILAGAVPIVRLVAEKKKVTLLVDAADDARRLRVDASKLQQVLVNLVGNAVEHSVAGQRVWISAAWRPAGRGDPPGRPPDAPTADEPAARPYHQTDELIFAVRDEGAGIAPEDQTRLFSAFGRAGTRKTGGERSVGLGLTIARLIVAAHGGRIWVESEPGQGATFQFALPIQQSTPEAQQ